jgi:hypothetical protein
MLEWTPDFCPPGASCTLEVSHDWTTVKRFIACCPHHQSLRETLSDQELFESLVQSSRDKEAVRHAVKKHLKLDKEAEPPGFEVLQDGSIVVLSGLDASEKRKILQDLDKGVKHAVPGTCKVRLE